LIDSECRYLPSGIDTLRFCPYPNAPRRSIDVLSIGRRSEQTHQALLRTVDEDMFYMYDTLSNLASENLEHHRLLLANMAKRSRYFIANPSRINDPEETGGQSEFGYRHFEGAAAGAIVIGERPKNREFDRIFHWDGALIDLPFGSDNIAEVMRELDRQPERQITIRRNNMTQALLHHDWAYRWETVLGLAGIAPSPQLLKRKETLKRLADMVAQQRIEP
jgi:hypothetical protein